MSHILITGASGLLGAEVVERLLDAGHSVVGVTHSVRDITTNSGRKIKAGRWSGSFPPAGQLLLVSGDITQPQLGLDDQTYQTLQAESDRIIHSAALTAFGRHPDKYQAINRLGTEHVIELAMPEGRTPIRLIQISTAYVCGEKAGRISETDLVRGQQFGNPYEVSKYGAELAVRQAIERGLPVVTLRPAIIVGESKRGVIRKFDTIYTVLRITTAGLVRTLPGDYGATLNIVPLDWVADSVIRTLDHFDSLVGRCFHLTADLGISLREINDICAEFPSFYVPRYLPRHLFEQIELVGLERRYYREIISLYESYFNRQIRFARSSLPGQPPAIASKTLLRRILRYALAVGYFNLNLVVR